MPDLHRRFRKPPGPSRPKHGFPILGESPRREIGYTIHTSGDSYDPSALGQSGEDRISKSLCTGPVASDESVIVFGQGDEFIKA
jgi:hypothetical protein